MSGSSDNPRAGLISDQAGVHGARVLEAVGDVVTLEVDIRRASGRTRPIRLLVDVGSAQPLVREVAPDRLPGFCPNRHIVNDGWFCMNYADEDPRPVRDAADAADWWARLLKFLSLQETASVLRRWPSRQEWAHGRAAAHQARAERCAARLGAALADALARRRLQAVKGPHFIQVRDAERRLFSVWTDARRVATLRQRCVCGSGLALSACADHAQIAADLATALLDWERDERRFWQALRETPCCGSLDACPLKSTTTPQHDWVEAA